MAVVGCNAFNATYNTEGQRITIGPAVTTTGYSYVGDIATETASWRVVLADVLSQRGRG